jgi:hypothetical protein
VTTDHPDLAALLRGELGNTEALAAAQHAHTCEPCQDELVDLAVGHGLLTAARVTLGTGAEPEDEEGESPRAVLPDELRRALRADRPRRLRRPLAAAAALVVLAGAAGVALSLGVFGTRDGRGATQPVAQTETLQAVPGSGLPRVTGRVSMALERGHVTRMRLYPGTLPTAPKGEFYYAWLFDPATSKMLPLGQVTPGHVATFDMPESLIASYSAIDVSLEPDDGDPAHSVTSVLRATYAPPTKGRTS